MPSLDDIVAFWTACASRHANHAWFVYRKTQPPPIASVVMNTQEGVFEVTFEGGDVFLVDPGGNGRPR